MNMSILAEVTETLDITLTDDAVMYLGRTETVTSSCDDMSVADDEISSVTFDNFEAGSNTQFYG